MQIESVHCMLLFSFLSLTCFLKENAAKSSRIAEIKKRSFSSVSKVGIVMIGFACISKNALSIIIYFSTNL